MDKSLTLNREHKFHLHILQSEFDKKISRNSHYSLRKFSLEVGLEPSVLSKYFRKKRPISERAFETIVENLNLSKTLLKDKKEMFYRSLFEMKLLPEEHQDILNNWHAFAILECLNLSNSQPSISWLSKKTGLKQHIVSKTVNRLLDIGAIKVENEKWIDNFENITFIESENMDTISGRNYQKQIIELSKHSIENQPGQKKSHSNIIMAIDERHIPKIKEKIMLFRREINNFVTNNSEVKTDVYNLQINFHSILNQSENGEYHEKQI